MPARQPILRSKTLTIQPNSHWKIKGADRRYILIRIEDNSNGFDLAFTAPDVLPEDDEWMDKIGASITNSISVFTIDTGCSSDIHFRDSDNQGDELIEVLSDVQAVFEQVS